MLWKPDAEQAMQRLEAWWHQEIIDRPCIQITAPRAEQWWQVEHIPVPPMPATWEEYWTNLDYRVAAQAEGMRRTYFGGEALPVFSGNLGPDLFACFFGAQPTFNSPETTWVAPIIEDWDHAPDLTLDPSNRWLQLQLEFMRRGKEAAQGRWLMGMPDTHSNADGLAALRGQAPLAMDFYDHPAEVKAALDRILTACMQAYDLYFEILEPDKAGGSTSDWAKIWGSGRTSIIQCDYLAFVSPRIAEEFIMPHLAAEARALDHCVYHLDGPECLPHLDLLLEIKEIQAIQWVPGDGHRSLLQWIPMLKRIQAAGKSIQLAPTWPHEIPTLLQELRPEGLLFNCHVAEELEAKEIIARLPGWMK